MNKTILLSFDLEEFDIPEEYGQLLDDDLKFEVSRKGLSALVTLLEKLEIKATFFVTAVFALHYPDSIRQLSKQYEIASHGFYHSQFCLEDLSRSRQTLEEISGAKVAGFRMARLKPINEADIERAGYEYNSSMNPTYLPGRYNNLSQPRTAYYSGRLLNIPASVTPGIRFPLFWLSFKNLPLPLVKLASQVTLDTDRYVNLYFHPWEFTDLSQFKLPGYIKKDSGYKMLEKLEKYLVWLKQQGEFKTLLEFKQSF